MKPVTNITWDRSNECFGTLAVGGVVVAMVAYDAWHNDWMWLTANGRGDRAKTRDVAENDAVEAFRVTLTAEPTRSAPPASEDLSLYLAS